MNEKAKSSKTTAKTNPSTGQYKTDLSKKIALLNQKLRKKESEIESLRDTLLRSTADLSNFRKRTERDLQQRIQQANAGLIKEIVPVVDDFERSLKNELNEEAGTLRFREGVQLIYQKLLGILQKFGLEPMISLGRPFDVELHDALLQVEKEGVQPGQVVEEHEKGYLLFGKVVRHAKVIVSK